MYPLRLACLALWLSPLTLTACGTEPSTAPLVGRWGNPMTGLVAQAAAVELSLPCETKARFRGAVRLDEEGRFHLTGKARHFHGAFNVELVGHVQGARLNLTLTQFYDGGRDTRQEELLAGVTPDFPGVVCLA